MSESWWSKVPDTWKTVAVIVSAVILIIGTYRGAESYFAKQSEFQAHKQQIKCDFAEVSQSFQKAQTRQDIRWNTKETYELERKIKSSPAPDPVDVYRLEQLKKEKEEMDRDLGTKP
jgi:thiol:disulfide interchange protein